jgi:spectinomycin phosphotransferase/16S rRNA (guanine(1405)-N(7))-methyltransferase
VRTPPVDLSEESLLRALGREWKLAVEGMHYLAVGFGSHHWEVTEWDGTRWFLTVDELETKRQILDEPVRAALDRLRCALATAHDLRNAGLTFVVAPVPTLGGEPVVPLGDRFAAALYPFHEGQSFPWGEFSSELHRRAVLDLVAAVHSTPAERRGRAALDNFAIAHRDELEAVLRNPADVPACGAYAGATSVLVGQNVLPLRQLLTRYDQLVEVARAQPARSVLTHGEPHPGNTMLTPDGWLLIDWDTALVAPPERDLWSLDSGDGVISRAYTDATGVTPVQELLELYRIRWQLADIAVCVSRFRSRHTGGADDDESWQILRSLIGSLRADADRST